MFLTLLRPIAPSVLHSQTKCRLSIIRGNGIFIFMMLTPNDIHFSIVRVFSLQNILKSTIYIDIIEIRLMLLVSSLSESLSLNGNTEARS